MIRVAFLSDHDYSERGKRSTTKSSHIQYSNRYSVLVWRGALLLPVLVGRSIDKQKQQEGKVRDSAPFPSIMSFDPSAFLTLKFRGRSVVVRRDHCSDYSMMWVIPSEYFPIAFNFCDVMSSDCTGAKQGVIAVVQRNLRSLEPVNKENIVLLALIPDYPDQEEVQVSKEVWPLVSAIVQSVTIAFETSAFPMASRLFPTDNPVAAAID
jgi:hypothetical protein